jgi:16S rRNA (guanine527-N7)-methyltransferase
MDRSVLATGAATFGLSLAAHQIDRFEHLAAQLIEWNQRANLTAIADPSEIVRKHFLDSLALLSVCEWRHGARLIDVGSGAGFPGLPLKIARPDLQVTLLEANAKKCEFLRHVTATLDLSDLSIVQARAEDAARDPLQREQYDIATARAVAEMAVLVEYTLPFVQLGGCLAAQKSGEVQAEVARAQPAIAMLGGRLQRIAQVNVPGVVEARYVVIVDKIESTPEKYPRRAGQPKKKPIG